MNGPSMKGGNMADSDPRLKPVNLSLASGLMGGPYFGNSAEQATERYRGEELSLPLIARAMFNVGDRYVLSADISVSMLGTKYDGHGTGHDGVSETTVSTSAGLSFGSGPGQGSIISIAAGWRGDVLTGDSPHHGIYAMPRVDLFCDSVFMSGGVGGAYFPEQKEGALQFLVGGGYVFF
jgi:hypothetical protein